MTSPSGEGIHGEGCDHWDRLGKAGLPSPCGVEGRPVLRKKVSRAQLLGFLAKQPPAIVAMEACVLAHDGYAPLLREVRTAIIALGVGLISRRGSTAKSGLLFQGHRWNR